MWKQNQPQETTSVKQPPQDDVSLHPVKVERKEEDVTPKSETPQVGEEQEELRRLPDAFPQVPSSEPTPRHSVPTRGPQACAHLGATSPYAPRRSTGPCADGRSPDSVLFHQTIWMEHDRGAAAHEDPVTQIRQKLYTMQANLETLRTHCRSSCRSSRCTGIAQRTTYASNTTD